MELVDLIAGLLALIILEIVLGIDNLVFLTILVEKLPMEQRKRARTWGLTFAWVTRLILLASAVWLSKLTRPLFVIAQLSFSLRDLFLFAGGLFLITKATQEIRFDLEEDKLKLSDKETKKGSFKGIVFQIAIMDVIFSLDSVLTAIGLTNHFFIMATAITIAIIVMIFASESVGRFVFKHPTIKILALSFLILVGTLLVADSFSYHIPRGYIYFAMGYALTVEFINLKIRSLKKR